MRCFARQSLGRLLREPRVRFAPLAAACLVVVACGGTDQPPSASTSSAGAPPAPAPPGEACALLSASDVAEAVGNPVEAGRPSSGPSTCSWDSVDPDDVGVLLIAHAKGSTRELAALDE